MSDRTLHDKMRAADLIHHMLRQFAEAPSSTSWAGIVPARAPEIVNAATLTEPGDSLSTDEQNRLEMMMEERAREEAVDGHENFLDWVESNENVLGDYARYRRATADPQEWADLQERLL